MFKAWGYLWWYFSFRIYLQEKCEELFLVYRWNYVWYKCVKYLCYDSSYLMWIIFDRGFQSSSLIFGLAKCINISYLGYKNVGVNLNILKI